MKIVIAGDFCPKDRVANLLENNRFADVFGEVKDVTTKADYSIVNLECPIVEHETKPIEKQGPNLKSTAKAVDALRHACFDCVTLANNHFYDYGEVGVVNTINVLNSAKIDFVGGGYNAEEAAKVLYKEINGKRLAIVNCCEHEFSVATEKKGGSNPLNPISQFYTINEAKSRADYVIVIVHGGLEHYQLPSPRMKETYRFFIDAGADAVINHHQHCVSGYEFYNNKPIFYGLGNFCFDWEGKRNSPWNHGYMVSLNFNANNVLFDLHPYIQCNEIAGIEMMNEKQKVDFLQRIKQLNSIIGDDWQLNSKLSEWMIQNQMAYKIALEPYQNRYLAALYFRHFLPSFLSKKKLIRILNFIECESHLVSMINLIKIELK